MEERKTKAPVRKGEKEKLDLYQARALAAGVELIPCAVTHYGVFGDPFEAFIMEIAAARVAITAESLHVVHRACRRRILATLFAARARNVWQLLRATWPAPSHVSLSSQ